MISIIIPTLNEEQYIPNLLESLRKQSYTGFEIIVSDCGSTDSTINIAERYGCRIVRNEFDKNLTNPQRQAYACNNGAKEAHGEIFIFIDADMVLRQEDALEKIISIAKRDNIKIGTAKIVQSDTDVLSTIREMHRNWMPFTTQFILIKKEIFTKLGGFVPVKYCIDVDLTWRAKQKGYDIKYIPIPIEHTRKYKRSLTKSLYPGCNPITFKIRHPIKDMVNRQI